MPATRTTNDAEAPDALLIPDIEGGSTSWGTDAARSSLQCWCLSRCTVWHSNTSLPTWLSLCPLMNRTVRGHGFSLVGRTVGLTLTVGCCVAQHRLYSGRHSNPSQLVGRIQPRMLHCTDGALRCPLLSLLPTRDQATQSTRTHSLPHLTLTHHSAHPALGQPAYTHPLMVTIRLPACESTQRRRCCMQELARRPC